ncbi:uncharacterized protein G2W53_026556 [Senna tora]|uniref:Uncharacterized protein n=1 Tax=Senna tora TaxID=362788 RepID=A0A834TH75_9FABA|nr:uncharacterized protein G2W53_026556 [Senna tora]
MEGGGGPPFPFGQHQYENPSVEIPATQNQDVDATNTSINEEQPAPHAVVREPIHYITLANLNRIMRKYIVALKTVNPQIDDLGIEQMIDFEFARWFNEYHLISQPSSSASTGQPQQPVEELQHEVSTNPSQQQGTTNSTSVDSSAIIPRQRDPIDGKLWIQPCGQC